MGEQYKAFSVPLDNGTWRSRVFTSDWRCIFTTYTDTDAAGAWACKCAINEHKRNLATAEALGLDADAVQAAEVAL